MPLRKASGKRRSLGPAAEPDRGALPQDGDERPGFSQENKNQRIALFLRDFDEHAKEHVEEMKKQFDSLLQSAEKAFAVELLKMPPALRKMKRKDVLSKCAWPWPVTGVNLATFMNKFALSAGYFYFPTLPVKVTTIVEYENAEDTSAKKTTKKVSLFWFCPKYVRA
ncbi:BORE2 protein, partial [Sapayoa aenigma]|nr:BORE2 protein [Sapayoa aenigma]